MQVVPLVQCQCIGAMVDIIVIVIVFYCKNDLLSGGFIRIYVYMIIYICLCRHIGKFYGLCL